MSKIHVKGKVKFLKNDNQFFTTLKKRVDQYFEDQNISRHANFTMIFKTISLLITYIAALLILITFKPDFSIAIFIWVLLGLSKAGIGMSIMHDAIHGAYSANKTVNKVLGWTLHLAGGAVQNWKLQHNILHHTYTNITHMDDDIDAKIVLRLSPHILFKKFHKLQYIYVLFIYCLTTLYWVLLKDFVQFIKYTRNGVNPNKPAQNKILFIKILVIKSCYLFCFVALPIGAGIPVVQVVLGFLLMHAVSGFILTLVFQLAHAVEGTTHPMPNEAGIIENNWAIHQMNTTVNFSRKNKLLSWFVGGLNFQVEHHLFPRVCHVHYPKISDIVKATAEEFGIPYLENHTVASALSAHFKLLKNFGTVDLHEAIV